MAFWVKSQRQGGGCAGPPRRRGRSTPWSRGWSLPGTETQARADPRQEKSPECTWIPALCHARRSRPISKERAMPRFPGTLMLSLAILLAGCGPSSLPDTRPEDFQVTCEWSEGSLPPPFHYEYTITITSIGAGTVAMV